MISREPSVVTFTKVPENITKELAKTLVELKDKYDLDTEEVEATVKKSYFKSLVKQYFKKE
jgi:hypothetical protein